MQTVTVASMIGSLWILDSIHAIMNPKKSPRRGPKKDMKQNLPMICPKVNSSPSTIYTSTRKSTRAVPSFSRLSPSISVESCLDTPNSLSKATTATGSVAEIMTPKREHARKLNSFSVSNRSTKNMTAAVTKVEKISMGPAIRRILTNCRLKTYQSELKALSKIRAGRKMRKTSSGEGS